jgi:uncharacterized protein
MADRKIREVANSIKDFLKDRSIRLDKVIVFGSYIKGDYNKDSDIDIAIISQDFEDKDIFEKADMLRGLKWFLVESFALPFDIIPLSLKEWQEGTSLAVEFIKEGKVV